jgi:hypothetical protein
MDLSPKSVIGVAVEVDVAVGGTGVSVGVTVGGTGVSVFVAVGGTGVFVGEPVGGTGVSVIVGVAVLAGLVAVGVLLGPGVWLGVGVLVATNVAEGTDVPLPRITVTEPESHTLLPLPSSQKALTVYCWAPVTRKLKVINSDLETPLSRLREVGAPTQLLLIVTGLKFAVRFQIWVPLKLTS